MLSFSVPTNWTDELLEGIVEFPVEELYSSLPATLLQVVDAPPWFAQHYGRASKI